MNLADTYRRIIKSSKKGQGTRLTREECHAMANYDDAIRQCVEQDEADEKERREVTR